MNRPHSWDPWPLGNIGVAAGAQVEPRSCMSLLFASMTLLS